MTITLLPEGDGFGRIAVKGEPDAKGSYTWNDSTLKIAYKQPVTLLTGNVADTKGRFTCEGEPTSAKVRCTLRSLGWTSTTTSQNSRWLRVHRDRSTARLSHKGIRGHDPPAQSRARGDRPPRLRSGVRLHATQ